MFVAETQTSLLRGSISSGFFSLDYEHRVKSQEVRAIIACQPK